MFGSRKKDEKKPRRRLWPWGRRKEESHTEVESSSEETSSLQDVVPVADDLSVQNEPAAQEEQVVQEEPSVEVVVEASVTEGKLPEHQPPEIEEDSVLEGLQEEIPEQSALPAEQPEEKPEKQRFFARIKRGLNKTRNAFVDGVATVMIGKKEIDEELLEELETQLLMADIGVEATSTIIGGLTKRVRYRELGDVDALVNALKAELRQILEPADKPLVINTGHSPFVILVVGVNGVGKTTTIGKLARKFQYQGKRVMLAAGDTFRAAAVEQLQAWGERNDTPVIAQHTGADSASVLYDAFEAAKARGVDVLIADTAGRLHNKDNLMEELIKVKRVLGKLDPAAPHEVLMVIDAGTGQNALNQAKTFHQAVGLTGLALTKLDGTARGGVVFALSRAMQLPIRFLGVGEQVDDLKPFSAETFVEALFDPLELDPSGAGETPE